MSIAFSQAKLKGEERRAFLQAIQTQMQQVIIEGVTLVLQGFWSKKSRPNWDARSAVHAG